MKNMFSKVLEVLEANQDLKAVFTIEEIQEIKKLEMASYRKSMK